MDLQAIEEMARTEDAHWWFAARRAIVGGVLAGLKLPRESRVFEIGCGTGGNLGLLAEFGSLRACEPDPVAREIANRRGITEAVPGSLPGELPYANERFDLIAMLDVLEHVGPDQAALEVVRSRLAPGGRLLLTVPAFGFLWSGHDVVHQHFRRYRRSELGDKLVRAGFRPTYLSYYNTLLFPAVAGVRLGKRALGARHSGSDVSAGSGGIANTLLRTLFSAERHLVPRFRLPFGVSLIAVAERPRDQAASARPIAVSAVSSTGDAPTPSWCASQRSASSAAMHPVPAEVIAWR